MNLKPVIDELKAEGIDIAEEALMKVIKKLFSHLVSFAQKSENKFDDMAIPFIPSIEAALLAQVDKLDGECDLCK